MSCCRWGKGHVIADALGSPVENIGIVAASHFDREELVLRHGGDGPVTRLVGGFFSFEGSPLPAVMSALPPLIHIPRDDAGAPPWLAAISHFLVAEAQQPNPGSSLMISRLIDLLVIRTLRSWAASEANRMGWLGGLGEERIGRVLSAMHADPFRRWTVQSLAEVARMSRSIFAERFTVCGWRAAATLSFAVAPYHSRGFAPQRRIKSNGSSVSKRLRFGCSLQRAFKAHFGYAPSEARAQQLP